MNSVAGTGLHPHREGQYAGGLGVPWLMDVQMIFCDATTPGSMEKKTAASGYLTSQSVAAALSTCGWVWPVQEGEGGKGRQTGRTAEF